MNEENCLITPPLNAGVINATGDFSVYDKWEVLCAYLNSDADFRSEQTTFAIFNNYYKRERFWNADEILIKIDDEYALGPTKKKYPKILARHYVSTKKITFWRDFFYLIIKK